MKQTANSILLPLTIAVGSMLLVAKALSLLPLGTDMVAYVLFVLLAMLSGLAKR